VELNGVMPALSSQDCAPFLAAQLKTKEEDCVQSMEEESLVHFTVARNGWPGQDFVRLMEEPGRSVALFQIARKAIKEEDSVRHMEVENDALCQDAQSEPLGKDSVGLMEEENAVR